MGSRLQSVQTGVIDAPPKIMLYGQPGWGKSTLAASTPGAIVIQSEEGTNQLNATRFPPEMSRDFAGVKACLQELIDDPHGHKAVVLDTLDGIQSMIFADVCKEAKKSSIVDIGYGKGYDYAVDKWLELQSLLERVRAKRNMAIVLVAHSMVKGFKNPEGPDFDRYIPELHEKGWALFFKWCDAVIFCQFETLTLGDKPEEKGKAVNLPTPTRWLRTAKRMAWEAKNRYGMPESFKCELDRGWSIISDYLEAPKRIRAEIAAITAKADAELRGQVTAWLSTVGNNAGELQQGLERLRTRTAEKEKTS